MSFSQGLVLNYPQRQYDKDIDEESHSTNLWNELINQT